MNPEYEILTNALAELEVAGAHPIPWNPDPLFLTVGIRYQPSAWTERRLTAVERQQFSRTLRRLEAVGLIRRVFHSRAHRTARLQLTADGLARANQLAGHAANLAHVSAALKAAKWWPRLARDAKRAKP